MRACRAASAGFSRSTLARHDASTSFRQRTVSAIPSLSTRLTFSRMSGCVKDSAYGWGSVAVALTNASGSQPMPTATVYGRCDATSRWKSSISTSAWQPCRAWQWHTRTRASRAARRAA